MVGVIVISHGALAEALVSEVQFLTGDFQKIKWVSLRSKENREIIRNRIRENMNEVDDGDGIIILTDILGGTPTNLSLSFLKDEKVRVVTGVNVPMLMALSSYRSGRSLEEICHLVRKSGRRSIILVKEPLGFKKKVWRPIQDYYLRSIEQVSE